MDILGVSISALLADLLLFGNEKENEEKDIKADTSLPSKILDIEGIGTVKFITPSQKLFQESFDIYTSIFFNTEEKEDIKNCDAIENELIAKGIITDETKRKEQEIEIALSTTFEKLNNITDPEEKSRIEKEVDALRNKKVLNFINKTLNYKNSIEYKAFKESNMFLVLKCILTIDDKPLFETREEYEKYRIEKRNSMNVLLKEFMNFIGEPYEKFFD